MHPQREDQYWHRACMQSCWCCMIVPGGGLTIWNGMTCMDWAAVPISYFNWTRRESSTFTSTILWLTSLLARSRFNYSIVVIMCSHTSNDIWFVWLYTTSLRDLTFQVLPSLHSYLYVATSSGHGYNYVYITVIRYACLVLQYVTPTLYTAWLTINIALTVSCTQIYNLVSPSVHTHYVMHCTPLTSTLYFTSYIASILVNLLCLN